MCRAGAGPPGPGAEPRPPPLGTVLVRAEARGEGAGHLPRRGARPATAQAPATRRGRGPSGAPGRYQPPGPRLHRQTPRARHPGARRGHFRAPAHPSVATSKETRLGSPVPLPSVRVTGASPVPEPAGKSEHGTRGRRDVRWPAGSVTVHPILPPPAAQTLSIQRSRRPRTRAPGLTSVPGGSRLFGPRPRAAAHGVA